MYVALAPFKASPYALAFTNIACTDESRPPPLGEAASLGQHAIDGALPSTRIVIIHIAIIFKLQ